MMSIAVIFLWVPPHVVIKGNEIADKVVKGDQKNTLMWQLASVEQRSRA